MFGSESKLFQKASMNANNSGNSQYPGQLKGDIPDWKTRYEYNIGTEVKGPNDNYYRCIEDHVSNSFGVDLGSGKWVIFGGAGINTDNQLLSIVGNILSISGGNSVTLPSEHFANTDLTFTANRFHNTDGYDLVFTVDNGVSDSMFYMTQGFMSMQSNGAGIGISGIYNYTAIAGGGIDKLFVTPLGVGIGINPDEAVGLEIIAPGSLSTDIALKVRNSADTRDNFRVLGTGQARVLANSFYGDHFYVSYVSDTGVERDAFRFGTYVQNFMGRTWTFDANTNGNIEGFRLFNDLTGDNQGMFTIQANNYCFGTVILPGEGVLAERRVMRLVNGVAPTTNVGDGFKMYAADQGGIAGRSSVHFRSEDGTVNSLGYYNGFGYASGTALGARLDIKAQGALSTDIVLRARDSADTYNLFEVRGDGRTYLKSGSTSKELQIYSDALYSYFVSSGSVSIIGSGQGDLRHDSWNLRNSSATPYGILSSITGLRFYSSRNILIGSQSPDGTNQISLTNGTPPTLTGADSFSMYSADIVAGNAAPHFRTEVGDVIKLYKQSSAGITTVGDLVTVLTNLGLLG